MAGVPAVLSVDFEYFSHIPAYRNARGETDRQRIGQKQVRWLSELFESNDVRSTFFTVASIARDDPSLIGELALDGHEIASHTVNHPHLTELTESEYRTELIESKSILESATGEDVVGFRAPSFDIADGHFSRLAGAGYEYDSSVVSCRKIPGWYGGEYSAARPCEAKAVHPNAPEGLREIPISVMPMLRLPLTGTWIRFFGVRYTIAGMRWLRRRGIPPVLYVHPWELAELPSVDGVPKRVYFRTGEYMRKAIRRIVAEPFQFVTTRELANDNDDDQAMEESV